MTGARATRATVPEPVPRAPLRSRPDGFDGRSMADELLDDLMPPELEWREIVRRHPIPTLLVAAAAGFWLGRSRRSAAVVDALAGVVATGLVAQVGAQLGGLPGLDEDFDVHDEGFV